MKPTALFTLALIAIPTHAQAPARTGPGVQAPQDARYADLIKTCKIPPPAGRGPAAGKGAAKGGAPAAPAPARTVEIKAIPGVINAGVQWKEVWQVDGNNADGIIPDQKGGILIAQNDNSTILQLDKNGKTTPLYKDLNTSGSVARSPKGGALFVVNRGLNESVMQLAPQRKTLADKFNGDPLDCLGGVLNDITADSKGGVYFTNGVVFHADSKGVVTRYGQGITTNGIVLSPDEKRLWVTNGPTLAVFDVQADGSLANQREFAKLQGGGDGSTIDTQGRLYVTVNAAGNPGVEVIAPDGKSLGFIPTPRGVISVTFSGPNRKTLYAVSRDNATNKDWIISIPMLAEGRKDRGK